MEFIVRIEQFSLISNRLVCFGNICLLDIKQGMIRISYLATLFVKKLSTI